MAVPVAGAFIRLESHRVVQSWGSRMQYKDQDEWPDSDQANWIGSMIRPHLIPPETHLSSHTESPHIHQISQSWDMSKRFFASLGKRDAAVVRGNLESGLIPPLSHLWQRFGTVASLALPMHGQISL